MKLAKELYFKESHIEKIKERINTEKFSALWKDIKDTADRVCELGSIQFPEDTFTVFYFVRKRMSDLAMAALITENEKYINELKKQVMYYVGESMEFWQGPAYPNRPRTRIYHGKEVLAGELETATITAAVVMAYEWGYQFFDDAEKTAIKKTLLEKPYMLLKNSTLFQMENWVMNHLCVIASSFVQLLLLIEDELPSFEEDMDIATEALRLWLEKTEADGSYGEGYHYWSYPINCLSSAAWSLWHTKGRRLEGMNNCRKSFEWAIYNQIGKYDVEGYDRPVAVATNFHDCPFLFQMEAPEALLYANYFKNPIAQWYIDEFLMDNPPRPDALHTTWHMLNTMLLALYDDTNIAEKPAVLETERVFAETGFTYLRNSWKGLCGEGNDTVMQLQSGGGGRSRSHQHFDKNSIMLFAKGEYFICDPGHSCYRGQSHEDYDTHTSSHNTICINGSDQVLNFVEKGMLHDEVRDYTSHNNKAVVTFKDFHDDVSFVKSHAEKCYSPYLKDCVRNIIFIKPDLFIIWDSVESNSKTDKIESGFNINNYDGKLQLDIKDNEIFAQRPKADLYMKVMSDVDYKIGTRDGKLHMAYHINTDQKIEGKYGSAKRIVLESEGKANYFTVICPMDKGAKKPEAECSFAEGKTTMNVKYNGHKYEITFTKDDILYKCDDGTYYTF